MSQERAEVLLVLPEHKFPAFYSKIPDSIQGNYNFNELALTCLQPTENIKTLKSQDYNIYDYIILQSEYAAQLFFEYLKTHNITCDINILSTGQSVSNIIQANNYSVYYQANIYNIESLTQEIINNKSIKFQKNNILIIGSQQHKQDKAELLLKENSINYNFFEIYQAIYNSEALAPLPVNYYKYIILTSPYMVECFARYLKSKNIILKSEIIFIALGTRTQASINYYYPENTCLLNKKNIYSYDGVLQVLGELIKRV